jgi:serine/threonine-protein kinase RsbW
MLSEPSAKPLLEQCGAFMKRRFTKASASMTDVFAFVDESLAAQNAGPSAAYAVQLAIEELFTNMVKYSPGGRNEVTIGIEKDGDRLVVTLVDEDVEPFDMTNNADVDTSKPLQERRVGGLGVHLVKKMVDEFHYRYENRSSIITITKKLEQ